MQNFYLQRDLQLVPVELVSETPYRRQVKTAENKVINIHPKNVAWGSLYPRLFQSEHKPQHVFSFKGRTIVGSYPLKAKDVNAVPSKEDYRFQPFIKDVIDSIHSGEHVLLTGGTGVGKTTHLLQLASRIQQPILRVNFNGETRMSDLIGKMTVLNGETKWVDGILPYAMRHGYWLLLDEIDFADPAVLSLLHPVLEQDPSLTLKENNGEIIKANPTFRIFATANSIGAMSDRAGAYGGTNHMNEAFLDRWQVLFVENLPEKEEIKVVRAQVPSLASSTAKRIVNFANMARKQEIGEGGVAYSGDNFSTRKVISWAKKAALHRDPIIGAQKAWLDKLPQDEQTAMLRILSTHFGSRKRSSNGVKMLKGVKRKVISIASPSAKKRGRPPKQAQTVRAVMSQP